MTERRPPLLLDSIAHINDTARDRVVVSGSHGGVSAAQFVLDAPHAPRLVMFNDAGVGKDQAGIAALAMLQAAGIACACYRHDSACIGQAQDALTHGVIGHVNPAAQALGVRVGDKVAQWASHGLGHAA